MSLSRRRTSSVVALASLACACGGGAATLHPAHTLPLGRVSGGAGVSAAFAFGEGERAIDQGRAAGTNGGNVSAAAEQQFLAGAVASALLAPGIAPWAPARASAATPKRGSPTRAGRRASTPGTRSRAIRSR